MPKLRLTLLPGQEQACPEGLLPMAFVTRVRRTIVDPAATAEASRVPESGWPARGRCVHRGVRTGSSAVAITSGPASSPASVIATGASVVESGPASWCTSSSRRARALLQAPSSKRVPAMGWRRPRGAVIPAAQGDMSYARLHGPQVMPNGRRGHGLPNEISERRDDCPARALFDDRGRSNGVQLGELGVEISVALCLDAA